MFGRIPLVSFWPPQEKIPKDVLLILRRGLTHLIYTEFSFACCPETNLIL